mmetsp:Transcript_57955/g.161747  ORF Transcript_57955/g.161747 Transcript_57955/m.161747 type:complete len:206 (+) Transcript_57955:844-1461(+)
MTGLVQGHRALFGDAHEPVVLLEPANHALGRALEIVHLDGGGIPTSSKDRSLVANVGDITACESRRQLRHPLGHDVLAYRILERHRLQMDVEDLFPLRQAGLIDRNLAVKTPRPLKRRVEDVSAICASEDDHASAGRKAIHLDEHLVQRVFSLVIATTAHASAPTLAADGVNLVNENDGRRTGSSLLEQVADAGGPDANEHLDEV